MSINKISDNLNVIQGVLDNSFAGVVSPELYKSLCVSKENLQRALESYGAEKKLKEGSVTMLYLDKLEVTIGKRHPYIKFINENYTGEIEFYALLEIMNLLEQIKTDDRVSQEGKMLIDKWIAEETVMFPISLLISHIKSSAVRDYLDDKQDFSYSERIESIEAYIQSGKQFSLDNEALSLLKSMMVEHLKKMTPNETMKFPAGCIGHATRVFIEKEENGDYRLFHSNTGMGCQNVGWKPSTIIEYSPIPKEKLENPEFWEKFILSCIQTDMDEMNELFYNLSNNKKRVVEQKDVQKIGSCSFKAIENELKRFILHTASTQEEGRAIYKIIKSLMLTQSKENLKGTIHPLLEDKLLEKEMVRNRYLAWVSLTPVEFEALKEGYLAAVRDMYDDGNGQVSPRFETQMDEIAEAILDKTPLQVLKILDEFVNNVADTCTIEKLEKIRSQYSDVMTFNGVNYLGLKSKLSLDNTKILFDEIFSDRKIKKQLFNILSVVSKQLLPRSISRAIESELYFPEIFGSEAIFLIREYTERQTFSIACAQLIEGWRNNQVTIEMLRRASEPFCFAIFEEHGIEIVKKLCTDTELDSDSINTCSLMIRRYHSNPKLIHNGPKVLKGDNYKVVEGLLAKANDPQVKEMLQSLLNAIVYDHVKEMLAEGEIKKALHFAKEASIMELIVDAELSLGDNQETACDYIVKEIVNPLQTVLLGALGELYLKHKCPNRALGVAAKMSSTESANKLLEKIIGYHINDNNMDAAQDLLNLEKIEGENLLKLELAMVQKLLMQGRLREFELIVSGYSDQKRKKMFYELSTLLIKTHAYMIPLQKMAQEKEGKIWEEFQIELLINLAMHLVQHNYFYDVDNFKILMYQLIGKKGSVGQRALQEIAMKMYEGKKFHYAFGFANLIKNEEARVEFINLSLAELVAYGFYRNDPIEIYLMVDCLKRIEDKNLFADAYISYLMKQGQESKLQLFAQKYIDGLMSEEEDDAAAAFVEKLKQKYKIEL